MKSNKILNAIANWLQYHSYKPNAWHASYLQIWYTIYTLMTLFNVNK